MKQLPLIFLLALTYALFVMGFHLALLDGILSLAIISLVLTAILLIPIKRGWYKRLQYPVLLAFAWISGTLMTGWGMNSTTFMVMFALILGTLAIVTLLSLVKALHFERQLLVWVMLSIIFSFFGSWVVYREASLFWTTLWASAAYMTLSVLLYNAVSLVQLSPDQPIVDSAKYIVFISIGLMSNAAIILMAVSS